MEKIRLQKAWEGLDLDISLTCLRLSHTHSLSISIYLPYPLPPSSPFSLPPLLCPPLSSTFLPPFLSLLILILNHTLSLPLFISLFPLSISLYILHSSHSLCTPLLCFPPYFPSYYYPPLYPPSLYPSPSFSHTLSTPPLYISLFPSHGLTHSISALLPPTISPIYLIHILVSTTFTSFYTPLFVCLSLLVKISHNLSTGLLCLSLSVTHEICTPRYLTLSVIECHISVT
jgi:hypothetical protein